MLPVVPVALPLPVCLTCLRTCLQLHTLRFHMIGSCAMPHTLRSALPRLYLPVRFKDAFPLYLPHLVPTHRYHRCTACRVYTATWDGLRFRFPPPQFCRYSPVGFPPIRTVPICRLRLLLYTTYHTTITIFYSLRIPSYPFYCYATAATLPANKFRYLLSLLTLNILLSPFLPFVVNTWLVRSSFHCCYLTCSHTTTTIYPKARFCTPYYTVSPLPTVFFCTTLMINLYKHPLLHHCSITAITTVCFGFVGFCLPACITTDLPLPTADSHPKHHYYWTYDSYLTPRYHCSVGFIAFCPVGLLVPVTAGLGTSPCHIGLWDGWTFTERFFPTQPDDTACLTRLYFPLPYIPRVPYCTCLVVCCVATTFGYACPITCGYPTVLVSYNSATLYLPNFDYYPQNALPPSPFMRLLV